MVWREIYIYVGKYGDMRNVNKEPYLDDDILYYEEKGV
jgi:hypothetical protein